ncbi:4425_t:CDS:2 [Diversispora eburnea]|uniref:4425_t:CDS:1 n=1 Tax=Diversispora eburnea TaxID=1213867 RepID=A0A9N9A8G0_9GLOM|nr:4425_t:CDS:2 [Diversispora eburnea]
MIPYKIPIIGHTLDDPETLEQVITQITIIHWKNTKTTYDFYNKEIGDCSNPKLINTVNGNFSSIIDRPVADVLVGQSVITLKKHLKPVLEKRLKDKEILDFAGRAELWDDIYEEQVRM